MTVRDANLPASIRWQSNLVRRPLFFVVTGVFGMASLAASLWDHHGRLQHRIARKWARVSMAVAGASVTVTGTNNLRPLAIYAANHASYMDPPAIFGYLPFQFRILAKESLWKWPFIGWHLHRSGQIPVDQENSIAGVHQALRALRSGMPLFIFPEGGRTKDGNLLPFMDGPSILAIRARVPLIPIGLTGTRELLPMGGSHFRPGPVRLSIGEPIDPSGFTIRQAGELTEQLREAVSELCSADCGRKALPVGQLTKGGEA